MPAVHYNVRKLRAVAAGLGVSETAALERVIAAGLEQLAQPKNSTPAVRRTARPIKRTARDEPYDFPTKDQMRRIAKRVSQTPGRVTQSLLA